MLDGLASVDAWALTTWRAQARPTWTHWPATTKPPLLDEPELDQLADDLRQFLRLLEHSLTRFIANGKPGYL
jgi:hypothetical protein